MNITGKMWRTRIRPLVLNLILFGLGVTTCLMFIQMSNNEIDSPIVYTNPQEYHSAQLLQPQKQQTQQEAPCDVTNSHNRGASGRNNIKNSNDNSIKNIGTGESNLNSDSRDVNNLPNNVHNNPNSNYYEEVGVVKAGDGVGERPSGNALQAVGPSHYSNKIIVNKRIIKSSNDVANEPYSSDGNKHPLDNNNNVYNSNNYIYGKGETGHKSIGPMVYVVTPTFYRPEQKPELTRLAQALLPVRHFIHWLVVDDVSQGSDLSFKDLETFMKRFPLTYTILKSFPPKSNTKIVGKPRGVGGRRAAIDWLRKHKLANANNTTGSNLDKKVMNSKGVVYFADDDNSYDSDVFRQMQNTKKVSMWPVGLVTDLGVSSPIVKNGRVVGFYDGWNGLRKFPVDMAGFAINLQLFHDKPHANMPFVAGYEEDELLRSLGITIQDIQPLANNCTEILVWHTKAVRNSWPKRPKNLKPTLASSTNLKYLLNSLPQKSLAGPTGANQNKSDSGFSLLNFIFGGL